MEATQYIQVALAAIAYTHLGKKFKVAQSPRLDTRGRSIVLSFFVSSISEKMVLPIR